MLEFLLDFEEAIDEVNKVLSSSPKSVKAILAKANALYGLGLFEKSMAQHFRGIKINPQFDNCAFSKGIR